MHKKINVDLKQHFQDVLKRNEEIKACYLNYSIN